MSLPLPLKGIDLGTVLIGWLIASFCNDRQFLTQGNQFLIKGKNRSLDFIFHIDERIGFARLQPWSSCCKTCIDRIIPLHRRPRIITRFSLDDPEGCFWRLTFSKQTLVSIERLDIHINFHGVVVRIHHPNLLTHVDIRRPSRQMNTGCQHGRPFIAEILYIDKAIESSRLIMVVPKEG